ncbi:hypothetical protein Hanom_Chr13g01201801 [Helianthus anomalus]
MMMFDDGEVRGGVVLDNNYGVASDGHHGGWWLWWFRSVTSDLPAWDRVGLGATRKVVGLCMGLC